MSRFDERAEASAERAGGNGKGRPSAAEIRRVRRALTVGHRRLKSDLSSLDVLLNLAEGVSTPENGPPPVGTNSNREAVRFMGRVADDLRQVRAAITAVQFDPDDKQRFRLSLKEMISAWELRAKATGTADVNRAKALFVQVKEAERRAKVAKKGLGPYFPAIDQEAEEEREEEREEELEGTS